MRAAVLRWPALALTGCETTAEKSAKLERAALANQARPPPRGAKGLEITRASTVIKVARAPSCTAPKERRPRWYAAQHSATTLSGVPIAITVRAPAGRPSSRTTAGGLAASLVPAPSLAGARRADLGRRPDPGERDADGGDGRGGRRQAGRGPRAQGRWSRPPPGEEPGGLTVRQGTVANHSSLAQTELASTPSPPRRPGTGRRASRPDIPRRATPRRRSKSSSSAQPPGAQITIDAPPTAADG